MMNDKNNRRGLSGGRAETIDAAGASRSHAAIIPHNMGNRQDLRLSNGRIGGVIFGDVLRKVCQYSKHYHRRLRAWGIDSAVLLEAAKRGARLVEVVDTERGETWHADIDFIITHGMRFDFGHGLQVFLPLKDWHRLGDGAEPEGGQLDLWGVGHGT